MEAEGSAGPDVTEVGFLPVSDFFIVVSWIDLFDTAPRGVRVSAPLPQSERHCFVLHDQYYQYMVIVDIRGANP